MMHCIIVTLTHQPLVAPATCCACHLLRLPLVAPVVCLIIHLLHRLAVTSATSCTYNHPLLATHAPTPIPFCMSYSFVIACHVVSIYYHLPLITRLSSFATFYSFTITCHFSPVCHHLLPPFTNRLPPSTSSRIC